MLLPVPAESLHTVIQPIVHSINGSVWGHEALLRGPEGSIWESPAMLFSEADRQNQRAGLEYQARKLAVERLPDLPVDQLLFVNIDPLILPADPPIDAPSDRVVLEISESRSLLDNPQSLAQLQLWRKQGHLLAIDDYGSGFMSLSALLTLRPDILKIDRFIVAGVDHDPIRRAAIEAILHIARKSGMITIAEGVETPQEFWTLRYCGVRYMQGYLLGRPQVQPIIGNVSLPVVRGGPNLK